MGCIDEAEKELCQFIEFHLLYFSIDQSIRL